MNDMDRTSGYRTYSSWQIFGLTLLRVMVGWHFLYEGLIKLYTPYWSAQSYLQGSSGPLRHVFQGIAANDTLLNIVNFLNVWGLILIGLGLFAGLFSKTCKIAGILLLALYYIAYPPFASAGINPHVEGSYWIINKNLIEMAALFVLLLFPTGHITGLDKFIHRKKHLTSLSPA